MEAEASHWKCRQGGGGARGSWKAAQHTVGDPQEACPLSARWGPPWGAGDRAGAAASPSPGTRDAAFCLVALSGRYQILSRLPSLIPQFRGGRAAGRQAKSLVLTQLAGRGRKGGATGLPVTESPPTGLRASSCGVPSGDQPWLGPVQPQPSDCNSGLWTGQFEFLSVAWTAAVTCCLSAGFPWEQGEGPATSMQKSARLGSSGPGAKVSPPSGCQTAGLFSQAGLTTFLLHKG